MARLRSFADDWVGRCAPGVIVNAFIVHQFVSKADKNDCRSVAYKLMLSLASAKIYGWQP